MLKILIQNNTGPQVLIDMFSRDPNFSRKLTVDLVVNVKASASTDEDPGFESCLRRDFFGVESYQ